MPGSTVAPARSTTRSSGRAPPGSPSSTEVMRSPSTATVARSSTVPSPTTTRAPSRTSRGATAVTRSVPEDRGTLGDVEGVGVEPGDPGNVLRHEHHFVGLGLVGLEGLEGLEGLPAFEEAEPVGLLHVLRPPVVDAPGVLSAAVADVPEGGEGHLPLVFGKFEVAAQGVHRDLSPCSCLLY